MFLLPQTNRDRNRKSSCQRNKSGFHFDAKSNSPSQHALSQDLLIRITGSDNRTHLGDLQLMPILYLFTGLNTSPKRSRQRTTKSPRNGNRSMTTTTRMRFVIFRINYLDVNVVIIAELSLPYSRCIIFSHSSLFLSCQDIKPKKKIKDKRGADGKKSKKEEEEKWKW